MSRQSPESDCFDLAFQAGYPLDELSEVALEDYARVLTRARTAEVVRRRDDPGMVDGVHVCGPGGTVRQALLTDLEDFARSLLARHGGGGLGWS